MKKTISFTKKYKPNLTLTKKKKLTLALKKKRNSVYYIKDSVVMPPTLIKKEAY